MFVDVIYLGVRSVGVLGVVGLGKGCVARIFVLQADGYDYECL